jgi:hypothetical protein
VRKLKQKYVEPLDYVLSRPEPVAAAFAGHFLHAHESNDPEAIAQVAEIALVAHRTAKPRWNDMPQEDRALCNAFVFLLNGFQHGTAEEEPVAEPTAAPIPTSEGQK